MTLSRITPGAFPSTPRSASPPTTGRAYPETLAGFLDESEAPKIPVIVQIPLFSSVRDAEFLANEMPGVSVPESVVERMRRAEATGSEAVRAEGITIARETVEALRPVARGAQVAADQDVDAALEALEIS